MTFRKITAAVLFVRDLDRCAAFYRDVVGLEVVFTDDASYAFGMNDQDFALVKEAAGVDMINAEALGLQQPAGHRIMLCADVDDLDAEYAALTAKGLAFIKPPIDQPWGWRTAYFADPEGNLWELRQSIEPA